MIQQEANDANGGKRVARAHGVFYVNIKRRRIDDVFGVNNKRSACATGQYYCFQAASFIEFTRSVLTLRMILATSLNDRSAS